MQNLLLFVRPPQGDLFHIKGQISESDVKSIMFQLLQVTRVCLCVDV